MIEQLVNIGDADQMSQNVASDLGLHCLPNFNSKVKHAGSVILTSKSGTGLYIKIFEM